MVEKEHVMRPLTRLANIQAWVVHVPPLKKDINGRDACVNVFKKMLIIFVKHVLRDTLETVVVPVPVEVF